MSKKQSNDRESVERFTIKLRQGVKARAAKPKPKKTKPELNENA